jgi:probable F420-dependent oxidoreductase
MRPFQFLADARAAMGGRQLADRARRAEDMGYHALVIPDHLLDQLSPAVAMTAIATATSTLRVGAFVLNNDLRHPAVLAQDLAAIDVVSGGRLDVAMGAGWNRAEYDAIGLPFDPTPVRQARLAEAVAVVKGCLSGEPFSYSGKHYRITDHSGLPSVQRPHPPVMIGGGGRRTLSLAAREADIVGLAPRISAAGLDVRSLTLAATREKLAWVADAAGDRYSDLVFNVYPSGWPPVLTDDTAGAVGEVIAYLRERRGVELTEQEVLESPHLFIGSAQALAEKFERLRAELGITSFLLGDVGELEPVLARLAGT